MSSMPPELRGLRILVVEDNFLMAVARLLRERGVPFMFLTGYDDCSIVPVAFRDAPRLSKPFDRLEVAVTAARHFVSAAS